MHYGVHKLNFVLLDSEFRRHMPIYCHCYTGVSFSDQLRRRRWFSLLYMVSASRLCSGKVVRSYEGYEEPIGLKFPFPHSPSAWVESYVVD